MIDFTDAVLLLPNPPGNLTTMEGVETVPWEPHGGFELHELGQRLRRGFPVVGWLRDHGLELEVIDTDSRGTWFHLTSIEGGRNVEK